jgi:TonB family protein
MRGVVLNMRGVLIYRSNSGWRTLVAFVCASGIFATAICLGRTERNPQTISGSGNPDVSPEPTTEVVDAELEPEPDVAPPPAPTDDYFPEQEAPPARTITKKRKLVARPATATRSSQGLPRSDGEIFALYAPRPDYPCEARRQNAIGSGLASLTIDPATGVVISARMGRSTGKSILDASALRAFSRWKFRPGTATEIEIPITFRLTGVSY